MFNDTSRKLVLWTIASYIVAVSWVRGLQDHYMLQSALLVQLSTWSDSPHACLREAPWLELQADQPWTCADQPS